MPGPSGLQMAEHAEGEGSNIDASVFLHDVTLPGLVDDFTGRIVIRLVAILLIAQPVAGSEHRPTRRRRFEGDIRADWYKKTPNKQTSWRRAGCECTPQLWLCR
jgi:hypothetical protein